MSKHSKLLVAVLMMALCLVSFGCSKTKDENPAQAGSAAVESTGEKTIVFASDATWPPMEMVDSNKQVVGFDIDFIQAVAKEAGFKAVIKNTAWDGIFAGLDTGNYDAVISSVTIDDKRKAQYDFSLPYLNAGQVLVVPKTTTNVTTLAQMTGKKLGAQIGTTGAKEIKKNSAITLKTYDEVGLAFEDMAAGRVDGVVCDGPTAASFALQKAEYKEKFTIVGQPFTTEQYGIVVKKGNAATLELINKGIKAVQEKGIDKQIETKWLR